MKTVHLSFAQKLENRHMKLDGEETSQINFIRIYILFSKMRFWPRKIKTALMDAPLLTSHSHAPHLPLTVENKLPVGSED